MFVVYKNGTHFLETDDYATACSAARKDALRNRLSSYSVWDKSTVGRSIRSSKERPLYQIHAGATYTTPGLVVVT